ENLLSEFLPESITSKINTLAAHQRMTLPAECFALIQRCQQLAALSHGSFDISVSPLKKIYNFKNDQFELPVRKIIRTVLEKVGYEKIILNEEEKTIRFTSTDMNISFAAIGKGYAADMVKKIWLQNNIQHGYINASGDLCAFGKNAEGIPWKVGIA